MATACGVGGVSGGDDDGPSGADASPDLDDGGNPDTSGVSVEFVYLAADGEPAGGADPIELEGCIISSVTVQMHELQLIGDTAPAGDLVVDSRAVSYPRDDEARVSFSAAPPGLYSRFNFDVERAWANESLPDGFDEERLSIRVVGEAKLQGNDRDFDFSDDQKISVDLDFAEEATPGVHRTIIVEVDLAAWFEGLDWDEISGGQGGGNDPILIGMGEEEEVAQTLRDRVADAFQARE
ncbi:MAG TPA: hypothetical protein VMZ28_06160 [Kofleriaceae bacterium]|nr:hypothetical protein [Kofleriaceae bacterium]